MKCLAADRAAEQAIRKNWDRKAWDLRGEPSSVFVRIIVCLLFQRLQMPIVSKFPATSFLVRSAHSARGKIHRYLLPFYGILN
jgi:hypothetical protein